MTVEKQEPLSVLPESLWAWDTPPPGMGLATPALPILSPQEQLL